MKIRPSLLVPVAACLLLAACNNKLTMENYNKLRMGMSFDEVKQVLGSPERCSDMMTVKSCTWGDDKRYVNVNFIADKVVLFNSENLR